MNNINEPVTEVDDQVDEASGILIEEYLRIQDLGDGTVLYEGRT